jgi:hypothetical protein
VRYQPYERDYGTFWYPHFRSFLLPDGRILVNLDYEFYPGDKTIDEDTLALLFDPAGKLERKTSFSSRSVIGIQPDGKMIVADFYDQPASLKRYNDDFSVDPAFSAEVGLGNGFLGAVQPDGKILFTNGLENVTIHRLNSDGSVDAPFPADIGPFYQIEEIVSHTNGSFLIEAEELETNSPSCFARVYSHEGQWIGSLYQSSYESPGNFCSFVDFAPHPEGGFIWSHYKNNLYKSKADWRWIRNSGMRVKWMLTLILAMKSPALIFIRSSSQMVKS